LEVHDEAVAGRDEQVAVVRVTVQAVRRLAAGQEGASERSHLLRGLGAADAAALVIPLT
jgi:hypothetical protein